MISLAGVGSRRNAASAASAAGVDEGHRLGGVLRIRQSVARSNRGPRPGRRSRRAPHRGRRRRAPEARRHPREGAARWPAGAPRGSIRRHGSRGRSGPCRPASPRPGRTHRASPSGSRRRGARRARAARSASPRVRGSPRPMHHPVRRQDEERPRTRARAGASGRNPSLARMPRPPGCRPAARPGSAAPSRIDGGHPRS